MNVRIFAIDPSTAVVGVAFVEFTIAPSGAIASRNVIRADAYDAESGLKRARKEYAVLKKLDSLSLRMWRIQWLAHFVRLYNRPGGLTHIAFEEPSQRGYAATAGIHQAIGAIFSSMITDFDMVPVLSINASTCKALYGAQKFRAKGTSATTLEEKERAVAWAHATFPNWVFDPFCPSDQLRNEAMADALAVAEAAAQRIGLESVGIVKKKPTRRKPTARSVQTGQ